MFAPSGDSARGLGLVTAVVVGAAVVAVFGPAAARAGAAGRPAIRALTARLTARNLDADLDGLPGWNPGRASRRRINAPS
ncbi:hypothetical protein GCM10010317_091080 [Streptomyces mirabilis]|nr:hypothetical protein GCM10010317_091080 [Streptomyces mirabilis]